MRDQTEPSQDKEEYRSPDIIDVGDVIASTSGHGSPVRDLASDPPTYYNAGGSNTEGSREVDLGDE